MKFRPLFAIPVGTLLAVGALTGCSPAEQPATTSSPTDTVGDEWSYHGANGPEHWGDYGCGVREHDRLA